VLRSKVEKPVEVDVEKEVPVERIVDSSLVDFGKGKRR
jgi:hypothetical protein